MILLQIDFKCKLCGNKDKFYTMPVEKKVQDGTVVNLKQYHLRCKKCNQKYLLHFDIDIL